MWQGLPGRELEIDMTTTSSSLEEECFKETIDYSEDGDDHRIVQLLLIFNEKAKGIQIVDRTLEIGKGQYQEHFCDRQRE